MILLEEHGISFVKATLVPAPREAIEVDIDIDNELIGRPVPRDVGAYLPCPGFVTLAAVLTPSPATDQTG